MSSAFGRWPSLPNEGSIARRIGAMLLAPDDEWQLQHRTPRIEGLAERATPQPEELIAPPLTSHAA